MTGVQTCALPISKHDDRGDHSVKADDKHGGGKPDKGDDKHAGAGGSGKPHEGDGGKPQPMPPWSLNINRPNITATTRWPRYW